LQSSSYLKGIENEREKKYSSKPRSQAGLFCCLFRDGQQTENGHAVGFMAAVKSENMIPMRDGLHSGHAMTAVKNLIVLAIAISLP
jgi:hypothetical protein